MTKEQENELMNDIAAQPAEGYATERGVAATPDSRPSPGSALMPALCTWSLARNEDYAVKVACLRGLVARLTEARLNPSAWISPEDIAASLAIYYESKAEVTQGPNDKIRDRDDNALSQQEEI